MTPCIVCGGENFAPLVTQGPWVWVRCGDCGFVRLSAMPSDDDARALQDSDTAAGYIASYEKRAEQKLRRCLGRIARLKRAMPGPHFLDIGSNMGFAVEAARRQGLQALGVEINPALVAAARIRFPACQFREGMLEEQDFDGRKFDGAYCSEVIEHVPECGRLLAAIAGHLRPGGVLYLTTPHIREYTRGRNPARWRDFGAPDHKLYFNEATITRLLLAHGYGRVQILFSFWRGLKLLAWRG